MNSIEKNKCSNCGSERVKVTGPFARVKLEGEPAYKDGVTGLSCQECGHKETKEEC